MPVPALGRVVVAQVEVRFGAKVAAGEVVAGHEIGRAEDVERVGGAILRDQAARARQPRLHVLPIDRQRLVEMLVRLFERGRPHLQVALQLLGVRFGHRVRVGGDLDVRGVHLDRGQFHQP